MYWAAGRPEISPNILANYYTKVKKKLQEIRIFSQFLGILLWEWVSGFGNLCVIKNCRTFSHRFSGYCGPVLHLFHRFAVPLPLKGKVLVR
jgi:hypothetical protein